MKMKFLRLMIIIRCSFWFDVESFHIQNWLFYLFDHLLGHCNILLFDSDFNENIQDFTLILKGFVISLQKLLVYFNDAKEFLHLINR